MTLTAPLAPRPGRPRTGPGGCRLADLPQHTGPLTPEAARALDVLTERLAMPRWRIVSAALVALDRATEAR